MWALKMVGTDLRNIQSPTKLFQTVCYQTHKMENPALYSLMFLWFLYLQWIFKSLSQYFNCLYSNACLHYEAGRTGNHLLFVSPVLAYLQHSHTHRVFNSVLLKGIFTFLKNPPFFFSLPILHVGQKAASL